MPITIAPEAPDDAFPSDHVALTAGALLTPLVSLEDTVRRTIDFAKRARATLPNLGISLVIPDRVATVRQLLEAGLTDHVQILIGDAIGETTIAIRRALPADSRARMLWWVSNDPVIDVQATWLRWVSAQVRLVTSPLGAPIDFDELREDIRVHAERVRDEQEGTREF